MALISRVKDLGNGFYTICTQEFTPMIGEIYINGECWGSVTQAIRQTESDFKAEVQAAEAAIIRDACLDRVNVQVSYRLAKKGIDY